MASLALGIPAALGFMLKFTPMCQFATRTVVGKIHQSLFNLLVVRVVLDVGKKSPNILLIPGYEDLRHLLAN